MTVAELRFAQFAIEALRDIERRLLLWPSIAPRSTVVFAAVARVHDHGFEGSAGILFAVCRGRAARNCEQAQRARAGDINAAIRSMRTPSARRGVPEISELQAPLKRAARIHPSTVALARRSVSRQKPLVFSRSKFKGLYPIYADTIRDSSVGSGLQFPGLQEECNSSSGDPGPEADRRLPARPRAPSAPTRNARPRR